MCDRAHFASAAQGRYGVTQEAVGSRDHSGFWDTRREQGELHEPPSLRHMARTGSEPLPRDTRGAGECTGRGAEERPHKGGCSTGCPPGTAWRSACATAEQLVGTCGFAFDRESRDNSAVVALLRAESPKVSKNPGLVAQHGLGTTRPLQSVPMSAVTVALGGLGLGGVVVMAKVGLWVQEVSHSPTGSGGVRHNRSCHCDPTALSFGKGAVKGLGGFAALWVTALHPSLPPHSMWPVVCPHSTTAKGLGAPNPPNPRAEGTWSRTSVRSPAGDGRKPQGLSPVLAVVREL